MFIIFLLLLVVLVLTSAGVADEELNFFTVKGGAAGVERTTGDSERPGGEGKSDGQGYPRKEDGNSHCYEEVEGDDTEAILSPGGAVLVFELIKTFRFLVDFIR